MNKLLQLTPNSWLIRGNNENSGLLLKREADFLFMNIVKRLVFKSMEEVRAKFNPLKDEIVEDPINPTLMIDGFPVKHANVVVVSEKPALYNKGSDVIFAAGYWGLKFTYGWTLALCPKQSTTIEHDSVGPFRNRLEGLNRLSALNNKHNIDQQRTI